MEWVWALWIYITAGENRKAEVMVGQGKIVTLEELLPYDWRK